MIPVCPHCGSNHGYDFNGSLITHERVEIESSFLNNEYTHFNDSLEVWSTHYGDSTEDTVKIVEFLGDSVTCSECKEIITDKDFINQLLDTVQEFVETRNW